MLYIVERDWTQFIINHEEMSSKPQSLGASLEEVHNTAAAQNPAQSRRSQKVKHTIAAKFQASGGLLVALRNVKDVDGSHQPVRPQHASSYTKAVLILFASRYYLASC